MATDKKNIGQVLTSITNNRNRISKVFYDMQLKDNNEVSIIENDSTLAQLAEAAESINVVEVKNNEPILLHEGNKHKDFPAGTYFPEAQRVEIDVDTTYSSGVYPLREPVTYGGGDTKKVFTSFIVRKVPVENPTIKLENIISSTDDPETNNVYTINAGTVNSEIMGGVQTPCWFDKIEIPQVMLGDYTADPEDVFDPSRTGVIEITAQTLNDRDEIEFASSGIRSVTIPVPELTDYSQEYDLMEVPLDVTKDDATGEITVSDPVLTLNAAFISTSNITIELGDVYKALAAI